MERIDSAHSIWLFDTERMRFRRLPERRRPVRRSRSTATGEPYFGLEIETSGAFTVALNPERTKRLLRSWRDDPDASVAAELELLPGCHRELRLEIVDVAWPDP